MRGGTSTKDIAAALWVSPSTVRKHLENVYTKLDVHGRTAAVASTATPGRRSSALTGADDVRSPAAPRSPTGRGTLLKPASVRVRPLPGHSQ